MPDQFMIIAGSMWRKIFVTLIAAGVFVSILEVTPLDSPNLPWLRPASAESVYLTPLPGTKITFRATAYCKGLVTQAGVAAQSGVGQGVHPQRPSGSRRDRKPG